MAYEIDGKLRGPKELGNEDADWHVELADRGRSPSNFMFIQFGSFGVPREEAERIVERVLAGLNADETT